MRSVSWAVLAVGAIFVAGAIADEQPNRAGPPYTLKVVKHGEKARKQYCDSTFTIDELGNWTSKTKFSNGIEHEGDHYRATLVLKDKKGKDFLALSQMVGLNAAMHCSGSCEETLEHRGVADVTSHDLTAEGAKYQCAVHDDKDDFGIAVGAAITITCYMAGAPCHGVMP